MQQGYGIPQHHLLATDQSHLPKTGDPAGIEFRGDFVIVAIEFLCSSGPVRRPPILSAIRIGGSTPDESVARDELQPLLDSGFASF